MKKLFGLVLCLVVPSFCFAQDPEAEKLLAEQRAAIKKLDMLDGMWRGPAWTMERSKGKHELTQTERVGSLLQGTVKVVEGRGYEPDGRTTFNAFAVISYDVQKKSYFMRSYAMGRSGDMPLTVKDDGFVWERPAGPNMTVRYTATVKDGQWKEVGELLQKDKEPRQIFEMTLKRVGDSTWPAEGAVPAK
jgi:hypothetical protein